MDEGIQAVVHRHRWLRAVLALLLAGCCALPALAAQRIALVVGVDDYAGSRARVDATKTGALRDLSLAAADASAIGQQLERLGFQVTVVKGQRGAPLNYAQLSTAIDQFEARVLSGSGDVALFYFAGHGVQPAKDSLGASEGLWLLPSDADLTMGNVRAGTARAIAFSRLENLFRDRPWKAPVIVIDACRNELPLAGSRSAPMSRGLTMPLLSAGALVAFSTAPGELAYEPAGARNSLYTTVLLEELARPGQNLAMAFLTAQSRAGTHREHRQLPQLVINGGQPGGIFLAGTDDPPPSPFDPRQAELALWQGTQQANTLAAYRAYKQRYPNGDYVALADIQIERLGAPVPVQTPPSVLDSTAQSAPASTAGADANGFVDRGNGVLFDTQTGLEWTQRDNGSNIDWNAAERHCANLSIAGGGWRLPSIDELAAIYDLPGGGTTVCGKRTCKVSPAFRLDSYWFWSGTRKGSWEAWGMVLSYGGRTLLPVSDPDNRRALCVRRRS